MVRRLPWEQAADNGTFPPPSSTPARSRRPKPIIDSSDIELSPQKDPKTRNALSSVPSPIREHSGHRRARSTSAPQGPPEEVFMIDGFQNDDKYRMVEDEFLDIAKEYTQHLHAAEYLRLKAAARNKSAATAGEITRPVIGSLPDATKRKLESIDRAKKQADAVSKLKKEKAKIEYESDPEAPEPWLGTALHGLMEEPTRTTSTITDVVETASTSKAAKGFKGSKLGRANDYGLDSGDDTDQAPPRPRQAMKEVETESEDDDLDAPIITSWKQKLPVNSSSPAIKKEIKSEPDLPPPPRRSLFARTSAAVSTPTPPSTTSTPPEASVSVKAEQAEQAEQAEVTELPRTSADILARMAKRRELARRKREREEEDKKREELAAKKTKESVIPTFL